VSARERLGRVALLVASVLVVLAVLEVTLRWRPTLLGQEFANGALSRYSTRAGGIFYRDRALRMNFMIPDHRATMYYNGYVWRHETDALGFRNRPLHVPADVMLLGDSVVYGHGVDFEHTLGHELERRTGLRVANLGRQGDCAYQEAYLLTEYLPVFRPRAVVHVFTRNDIDDLYLWLSESAMADFVARPFERITYPRRTDPATALAERDRALRERTPWKRAEQDLYVAKMFRWLLGGRSRGRAGVAAVAVAEAGPPPRGAGTDPESLGWRYTAHALGYMKYAAERAGARFLMAPYAEGRQLEILRDVAARHGIEIVDTSALYGGPSFLPHDGHLAPHGSRTMAGLIAAALERPPAPGPREAAGDAKTHY